MGWYFFYFFFLQKFGKIRKNSGEVINFLILSSASWLRPFTGQAWTFSKSQRRRQNQRIFGHYTSVFSPQRPLLSGRLSHTGNPSSARWGRECLPNLPPGSPLALVFHTSEVYSEQHSNEGEEPTIPQCCLWAPVAAPRTLVPLSGNLWLQASVPFVVLQTHQGSNFFGKDDLVRWRGKKMHKHHD